MQKKVAARSSETSLHSVTAVKTGLDFHMKDAYLFQLQVNPDKRFLVHFTAFLYLCLTGTE
jgi:hypothetical protein